ncbi:MAG: hydrolase [Deltaproteobacteria bacterium]|nr:hydrolase [Deltaproteobacteria bacterium]
MKLKRYQTDLTAEEKTRPYARYFYKKLAPVPEETMRAIQAGPMNPRDALAFERLNDLLDPGYHAVETGYCRMPDNSCYVAVLTMMPEVTAEMIDWWFWWHALESLRYKIWYPGSHAGVSVENREQLENPLLSARERYWNNTQYPVEDVGIGPEIFSITFIPPEDIGFDVSRFVEAHVATAICAVVGSVTKKVRHTRMCHLVRRTSNGVEMRSRFWIGGNIKLDMFSQKSVVNRVANTKLIRKLTIPNATPYQMALHCAREYSNLAEILPELYRDWATR